MRNQDKTKRIRIKKRKTETMETMETKEMKRKEK